jgi:hypothetical protein
MAGVSMACPSDWLALSRCPASSSPARWYARQFAVGVLFGIGHSDRMLNRLLDAAQIEGVGWGIAAVEENACDAMRLDGCGDDWHGPCQSTATKLRPWSMAVRTASSTSSATTAGVPSAPKHEDHFAVAHAGFQIDDLVHPEIGRPVYLACCWMTPLLRSSAITAVSALLRAAPSLGGASLLSASPFGLCLSLAIAAEGSRSST